MQESDPWRPPVGRSGACGCNHGHHAPAGERATFRAGLPEGHVLATLMDEHGNILGLLDQLEKLGNGLTGAGSMASARIESVARQLVAAEPHHQREEQVLFPTLRDHGIAGPPDAMQAEHVELRALKHQVADLAAQATMGDDAVLEPLRNAVRTLVTTLRDHLAKEDGILYPMAFGAIAEDEWADLRQRCDSVGYCCGHRH